MNKFKLAVIALVAACAMTLLTCVPLPTVTSSRLITLSLEKVGRDTATFSGQPIRAIVQLQDSVDYDSLAWHTGRGNAVRPNYPIGYRSNHFDSIYLDWVSTPLNRDSACGCSYDSLYISIGGGYEQSNTVRVNVINIAPVLDSIKINKMQYSGLDTIIYSVFADTLLTIKIVAVDLDSRTLWYDWTPDNVNMKPDLKYPSIFYFSVPQGNFKDTFRLTINDANGGTINKRVLIYRGTPDNPPSLDSVTINKTTVSGSQNMYQVMFKAFDTLNLKAFAHDVDVWDTVHYAWSAAQKKTFLTVNPALMNTALYWCHTCRDTMKDTTIIIDTVRLWISDGTDSVVKQIQIEQGSIDHAPVLDSLIIGGVPASVTDTVQAISCKAGSLYHIRVYAHDPDTDTVGCTWTGSAIAMKGSLVARLQHISDTAADLSTLDSTYNDTVKLAITDGKLKKSMTLYMVVAPRIPQFDSLTVDDSVYSGADSVFYFEPGALKDTIHLKLFAEYAGNGKSDTLHYTWASLYKGRLIAVSGRVAKYLDTIPVPLDDTITVTATGGNRKFTKRVKFSFHAPSIDSISVGGDTILNLPSVIRDTIVSKTALPIMIFASDLDRGDTLSYTWASKVPAAITGKNNDMSSISYQTKNDTAFTDSLTVTVNDLQKNMIKQLFLITVKFPILILNTK